MDDTKMYLGQRGVALGRPGGAGEACYEDTMVACCQAGHDHCDHYDHI